jgi:hypothetical protein
MSGWTKLHESATESVHLSELIDDEPDAFALFMLMLAKAGVWGRFPGHPKLLKARVAPMSDRLSAQRISDLLPMLRERGFVTAYVGDSGEPLLYNTNHFAYNGKQAWHRVGKPEFPHPPDFQPPEDLLEYLRDVASGKFKGKAVHLECEKFGIPWDQSLTTPRDYSQGLLPGTTPQDHSLGTPCTTDVRLQTTDYRDNTHLRRAREGTADPAPAAGVEGPQGVCASCDDAQSTATAHGTATPDGETSAPATETIAPAGETITPPGVQTQHATPEPKPPPDHTALVLAIEGAYPQERSGKRRSRLTGFLRELAAPGCRVTEAQLAELLAIDPPLAGGTTAQYVLHAQGVVAGRMAVRSVTELAASETETGGRERVGVGAVLAAAGVAEVDAGRTEEAAEYGRSKLAAFLGSRPAREPPEGGAGVDGGADGTTGEGT